MLRLGRRNRFELISGEGRTDIAFDDGGMNLLSSDALRDLRDRFRAGAGEDFRAPNVLVFRSGRPGLFAAGADMAEMRDFTPTQAAGFSRLGQQLFDEIERLPMLTVAVIDGDCFGGALDLALAFDVRLASPRSRFAHPGARLGLATGFGGTTRWRKVLQRPAAQPLFIENRVLTAAEAERAGIVQVTDDAEKEIAKYANADPRAVRLVKELSAHAPALSRSQLRLMAQKLGTLYFR